MLATAVAAIAATYLLASLIALAPRKAGYSHIKHSISEMGEIGAPHQRFVAFGLFLPIGLAMLLVAYLVRPDSSAASNLALCIAIGYIGAAAYPCDPASPLFSTTRQALHNIAGAVQYIGGGIALTTLAERFGEPFETAGFIVLVTAIALCFPSPVRGIIQRIAETCLFGGLALVVWQIGAAV